MDLGKPVFDCVGLKNLVENAIGVKGPEIHLPSDVGISGYAPKNFGVRLVACLSNLIGSAQPERLIPTIFLATGAWTAWLLESKAIAHIPSDMPDEPMSPHPEMRTWLLQILDEVERCVLEMRNQAIDDKAAQKASGKIPQSIPLPEKYASWKQEPEYGALGSNKEPIG